MGTRWGGDDCFFLFSVLASLFSVFWFLFSVRYSGTVLLLGLFFVLLSFTYFWVLFLLVLDVPFLGWFF